MTGLKEEMIAGVEQSDEEQPQLPILYLSDNEAAGEAHRRILLFEERLVHGSSVEPGSWRDHRWLKAIRRKYDQVSVELFASDRFVRRVEKHPRVKLLYSKPIDPTEAGNLLHAVLLDNGSHHRRWLIFDSLLLPVSVLAAFLPGPNVWGYYLLFRVYSHWRSYRAASRASVKQVEAEFSERAEEVSRLLQDSGDMPAVLHKLREQYGLRAVQEHKLIPQSVFWKAAWQKLRGPAPNQA